MRHRILAAFFSLAAALSAAQALSSETDGRRWTACGWGGGGWFWSSAADPLDPDVFYMGGDVDGVWKTVDGGESWLFANMGLSNYAVYSLAVAPSNGDRVYALTGNGVCASSDGAAHWTHCAATKGLGIVAGRGGSVHAVAVDPGNPDVVYAGGKDGKAAKSTDGGASWKAMSYGGESGGAVCTIAVSGQDPRTVLLCSRNGGLYRSTDAGSSWSRVSSAPSSARAVFWAGPDAPRRWYGAFGADAVHVSQDDGATWTKLGEASSYECIDVVCSAADPLVVHALFANGYSTFISTSRDGGTSWTRSWNFAYDHAANPTLPGQGATGSFSGLKNLSISPADPDRIHSPGNWNPVMSHDGGRTWRESCRGADISCHHDLQFLGSDVYTATMDEGTLRTSDRGATWSGLCPTVWKAGLSGHHWRVIAQRLANGSTRVVSSVSPWANAGITYPVKVVWSEDGGRTFTEATGLPDYRPTANTMWGEGHGRAMAADPNNPDVIYLGIDGDPTSGRCGGGVFRSTDGGKSFSQLPNQPASRRMFYGLAVDPTDSKRIVWGACGDNSGVYVSNDAGASWQKKSWIGDWIYNVEITTSGTIYASGGNLYRSTDHGENFAVAGSFSGGTVLGIAVDPADEQRVWVSVAPWSDDATGGIYETTDGCRTWREISGDIGFIQPRVLRYDPSRHELWAAGNGLFRTKIDGEENAGEDSVERPVIGGLDAASGSVSVANAEKGASYAVYACEMLGGEFSPAGRRVRAKSDGALELGIELSAPPASMFFKVVAFPPETTGILHR